MRSTTMAAFLVGTSVLLSCDACEDDEEPDPDTPRGETDERQAAAAAPPGTTERPNVLLIVVDTLRADQLGAYGFDGPTSPHLDGLAERGTRFARHYATASTTLASVTSILTGRYTNGHGVYRNGVRWPDSLRGIASRSRDAGWNTAAFVASFALDGRFGVSRGFAHYDDSQADDHRGGDRWGRDFRRADEITDAAVAWLREQRTSRKPFFALVHYYDPHYPYAPPDAHRRPFDVGYDGELTGSLLDLQRIRARIEARNGKLGIEGRHARALYRGEVRFVDAELGRLLDHLDQGGWTERTVVIVTSDHGESFAEHEPLSAHLDDSDTAGVGYFDHGWSVYEPEIHVPLVVAGPGIGRGAVVRAPTSHVDLAPTLLERLDLPPPAELPGRSLLPELGGRLDGQPSGERLLFAEATKPRRESIEDDLSARLREAAWPNASNARCVISGHDKLVRWPWVDDRRELYDLEADPKEQRDRFDAPEHADTTERLLPALARWSARSPSDGVGEAQLDEEARRRLQALGYAQ